MYTNIIPKTSNLSNLNNPILNTNINNGQSINNNLIYQNSKLQNGINPLNNQQKIAIINIPNTLTNSKNIFRRSNSAFNIKPLIIKKNQLNSSGILIRSKISKKENKVTKNGKEISNIDINKDLEEFKNDTNQNSSINYIYNNNLINRDGDNFNNNYINNYNRNNLDRDLWDKTMPNVNQNYTNEDGTPFVNPMVRFVNFITDIFSSKKNENDSNEIINQNENNSPPLISQNNDLQNKSNENQNIISKTVKSNNEINNINNNQNQSKGLFLENNSSKILNRNKSHTNINQNLTLNKINQSTLNLNKNANFSNNKNPQPSLTRISKRDDLKSKKSETKISNRASNKIPLQPLNGIINSKNNKNANEKLNLVNRNSIITNKLNGNLQILNQPIYQKENRGFRFCHELTKAGKSADGNVKIDQDAPLMKLSIGGIIGFNMFGVLDGHGPHGHLVSQFCKEYFIKNITLYTELLKLQKGISTSEGIYTEFKSNNFYIILELFKKVDQEISTQTIFEYNTSGTTCNLVFQFNKHLICFNVGDSRSIIIYDEGNNRNHGIFPLSIDHKPNLPGEIERIRLSGGVVECLKDIYGNDLGPPRVFKVGRLYPSLAMSRSLGDFQAKEVGVISIPQIIEYDINFTTKYLVICSDGVWEFVSNEQVRNIGNIFYAKNDVVGFCAQLIIYSTKLWEQKDIIRDDITVVSVFF